MELQDELKPTTLQVVNALLETLPEHWESGVLKIRCNTHPGGVQGCAHSISNPDGLSDLVEPSEELYDKTWQLAELARKHGRPWKAATLTVRMDSNEEWDYSIDFEY